MLPTIRHKGQQKFKQLIDKFLNRPYCRKKIAYFG